MSLLIQYLVKLSISLAVVWLFYQFILRRLTFYSSNRWFLLGYTLFSFLIPFVNISSFIENKPNDIIQLVPSVHQYTIALEEASHCPVPLWSTNYDKWDFMAFGLIVVAGILLGRLLVRYFSFLRIQRNAKLISADGVRIFQVDENIIPFSFGNSIFINSTLHTETELQEIVRHEFVHVRQKHTVDILWAEMLCIINWYNPFAWLIKRSIRQNLEFIADNKVIENGINKKQYQYLLLKVIGNNQFSIATQFNFSSLKKRIVMMNKTKSAKRQLGRFLFLVPVLAIILLSFRKSFPASPGAKEVSVPIAINDTVPVLTVLNSKGYHVDIIDDNGNCTVVVHDKNKKEVKRVLLTEWDANPHKYESLYGEIGKSVAGVAIAVKAIKAKNADIKEVTVKGNIATVTLKNGKTETYTLSLNPERKAFEERCLIKEVAVEPAEVAEEVREVVAAEAITTVVENKIGTTALNSVNVTSATNTLQEARIAVKTPVSVTNKISTNSAVNPLSGTVAIEANPEIGELVTTRVNEVIRGELDIKVVITKGTTPEQLEKLISQLKEKGYELKFTNKDYNNGILTELSGSIKYKGSTSTFSFSDFEQATIKIYRDGDDVSFRIYTGKERVKS